MELPLLLAEKTLKPKEKTELLAQLLIQKQLRADDLLVFASTAKDAIKATCIEALEKATQEDPTILSETGFRWIMEALKASAPRIKWESARVIGNTAHYFPSLTEAAIPNLLDNSEHIGTVVRWSAAYALGVIVQLPTARKEELKAVLESILHREEKESIKKIYRSALKKAGI